MGKPISWQKPKFLTPKQNSPKVQCPEWLDPFGHHFHAWKYIYTIMFEAVPTNVKKTAFSAKKKTGPGLREVGEVQLLPRDPQPLPGWMRRGWGWGGLKMRPGLWVSGEQGQWPST